MQVSHLSRSTRLAAVAAVILTCSGLPKASAQQANVAEPAYRVGLARMPDTWIKLGFPGSLDVTQHGGGYALNLADFKAKFRKRASSKSLAMPEDFDIVKFMLAPSPLKDPSYQEAFCQLGGYFVDTPYRADATLLLRPLLKQANIDFQWKVVIAGQLGKLQDKDSVTDILTLLAEAKQDDQKGVLKAAVRKLGYEIPFEEEQPVRK